MTAQTDRLLAEVQVKIGGERLVSRRGVPYLRVDSDTTVAWFGRSQFFRVFEVQPSQFEQTRFNDNQKRTDFKTSDEVASYINHRGQIMRPQIP